MIIKLTLLLKFCELNDLKAGDGNNININQEDCRNVKRYYKKKPVF